MSMVTGIGHVGLSIALGLVVVGVGYLFSSLITHYLALSIGSIMLVVGLLVGLRALFSREKLINETELVEAGQRMVEKSEENKSMQKGAGYFAVLGAALSPDLSIVPIFLVAVPVGLSLALQTALVFAVSSLVTILLLVMLGSAGLSRAFERLPPKYNDAVVGFVIAGVGIYILLAG